MHQTDWRRRLSRGLGGTLSLALLLAVAGAMALRAAPSDREAGQRLGSCTWAQVTSPPSWTGSGAWNGEQLVLVDTIQRDLLHYSPDGRSRPKPVGALAKSLPNLYPVRIGMRDDGKLVLQVDAFRFLVLDHDYATTDNVNTLARVNRQGSTSTVIEKVFTWAPVGTDVVAFADLRSKLAGGKEETPAGIVRFSTRSGTESKGYQFFPADDDSREYHRLGYAYVSSLHGTAYYLLMDGLHSRLWRQEKGKAPVALPGFETSLPFGSHLPKLPRFVRPEDFTSVMAKVERSALPAGLYSWRGLTPGSEGLFLLSRQWSEQERRTHWFLSKVEAVSGRLLGTVRIPSFANHLFAVPGPDRWAFVEKGPAVGMREQEVRGFFTVAAERVRGVFESAAEIQTGQPLLDLCRQ